MLQKLKLSIGLFICIGSFVLSGCGFHLPNQTKINEALPTINVVGSYHHPYYKMVVNRLKANGVNLIIQDIDYTPKQDDQYPTLLIAQPSIQEEVVSVDSRAQAIESDLFISTASTLYLPKHRPILIKNSFTRSFLNKPGQSLASDVEKGTIILETEEELADQLVIHLSYLGRMSDPDYKAPLPSDLVYVEGEEQSELVASPQSNYDGLTLIEALQIQDLEEKSAAQTVSLDEINNAKTILNNKYQLPKQAPTISKRLLPTSELD